MLGRVGRELGCWALALLRHGWSLAKWLVCGWSRPQEQPLAPPMERDPTSRASQAAGGLVAQDLPHLGGPGSEQLLHTCRHVSHFLVPLLSRLV